MEENKTAPQKVSKITMGSLLGWAVGVFLVILGIVNISGGSTASGIWFLLGACLTLPPIIHAAAKRLHFALSAGVRVFLIAVLIVVGIATVNKTGSDAPAVTQGANQTAPQEQAISATATKLMADYEANEVAADAQYKGRLIEITGTISAIGKDILDTPYVALSTNSNIFGSVQCMFAKSDQAQLTPLSKETEITLRGRVSGKLGNVIVRECSILR